MNDSRQLLVRHGAVVLFAAVFPEQVGVPLPALLWLFAAGALVVAVRAAAGGSLLADLIGCFLGRRYGHRVLALLCRTSLDPGSCVRRMQDEYARFGINLNKAIG